MLLVFGDTIWMNACIICVMTATQPEGVTGQADVTKHIPGGLLAELCTCQLKAIFIVYVQLFFIFFPLRSMSIFTNEN